MFFRKSLSWIAIRFLIQLKFPKVKQLSTTNLATWLAQNQSKPLLLDGRTTEEYAVSRIEGAKLAPVNLEDLRNWEGIDTAVPIVVYCSVGYRSAAKARKLQQMGYQNVYNLEGSIFQWANEGRPVYQGSRLVKQVHPYNNFWGQLLNQELHPEEFNSKD